MSAADIQKLEKDTSISLNQNLTISLEDVEIFSKDISGYSVSSGENYTVALDVTISDQLKEEGLAREFINRIQRLRKDLNFDVTDRISIEVAKNNILEQAIKNNLTYICNETLTKNLDFTSIKNKEFVSIDLVEEITCNVIIKKH
jgi:isoleucyl-tRNA synthetase